ncbi:hypothetical protein ERW57_18840 [Aliivibrio finisterrensis]|uniref:Uncharacterized protein n=1 Tax=Aliivibrio finisterrensis TaxID=511998 RepID=A0A4Q5KNI5_9GAMM|nr:hypothetical protein ERW57_18840 [Aliivibrio finisterrensis]
MASEYIAVVQMKSSKYVVVDGVVNIWAVYSGVFILAYLIFYYFNSFKNKEPSSKQLNYAVLVSVLLIGPLFTLATYKMINSNLDNYVKCDSLNHWSSRYSSSTYAISNDICLNLVSDKNK